MWIKSISRSLAHRREGLVLFVSNRIPINDDSPLVKPTPTAATVLSPFGGMVKGDTLNDSGESSGCSVTKQMSPFSLHASFGETQEGEMRDEDEDRSNDESAVSSSSSVGCDELDIVSRVVSECTDGNIADVLEVDYFAIEDSNDDDELSGFLEALSQSSATETQDETDSSDRIIGVMGDREDLLTIPKVKRVLSFNTLKKLSEEAKLGIFSQKRPRLQSQPSSLNAAFALNTPLMYRKPTISSDEEDEIYSTMKDELFDYPEKSDSNDKEKTPVPLLTPPNSPLTFACDGDVATVCEWPYNLVVDSAMTAACELTPMSLSSLEDLELRDANFTELAC